MADEEKPPLASGEKEIPPSGEYRVPDSSQWARAWKLAAGVGALGAVCAVAGYAIDPRRFAFAYLMGFLTVLTMVLGSMFFVLLQHLTGAGWSVTVRRTSEFFVAGAIIIPVLAFPNLLSLGELYPWWQQSHGARGHEVQGHPGSVALAQEHGTPAEPAERAAMAVPGAG